VLKVLIFKKTHWHLTRIDKGDNEYTKLLKKQHKILLEKVNKWEKALITTDGYEPDSFAIKELLEKRKNELEVFAKSIIGVKSLGS
jgi:hypothetical protein